MKEHIRFIRPGLGTGYYWIWSGNLFAGWWFEPLWKIWKSIGMMKFPIYGKIKNGNQTTNQQPFGNSLYNLFMVRTWGMVFFIAPISRLKAPWESSPAIPRRGCDTFFYRWFGAPWRNLRGCGNVKALVGMDPILPLKMAEESRTHQGIVGRMETFSHKTTWPTLFDLATTGSTM